MAKWGKHPTTMLDPVGTPGDGSFWIEAGQAADGVALLTLHGDADLHVAPELRLRLGGAIDAGASSLVLDLSGVTFVDSTALGIMLSTSKRLTAAGGQLRLVVPQADVRRIFELTLLDRVLAIDVSRDAALAAAGLLPKTRA